MSSHVQYVLQPGVFPSPSSVRCQIQILLYCWPFSPLPRQNTLFPFLVHNSCCQHEPLNRAIGASLIPPPPTTAAENDSLFFIPFSRKSSNELNSHIGASEQSSQPAQASLRRAPPRSLRGLVRSGPTRACSSAKTTNGQTPPTKPSSRKPKAATPRPRQRRLSS